PKQVPHKDHYQRVSYLYQVSQTVAMGSSKSSEILSRMYNRNLNNISKKAVLKLSPLLKRQMCKKCNRVLVHGLNSTSCRIENTSKDKNPINDCLVTICKCGNIKRYPIGKDRNYKLFCERE
ncbi:hypothetical protein PACTADRAFT_29249, partial [Pachysolen tannophilus NRRL Y-2460]